MSLVSKIHLWKTWQYSNKCLEILNYWCKKNQVGGCQFCFQVLFLKIKCLECFRAKEFGEVHQNVNRKTNSAVSWYVKDCFSKLSYSSNFSDTKRCVFAYSIGLWNPDDTKFPFKINIILLEGVCHSKSPLWLFGKLYYSLTTLYVQVVLSVWFFRNCFLPLHATSQLLHPLYLPHNLY